MSARVTVSREPLPYLASGPGSVIWWGVVMLVVIEAVIYASFIFSYFYLRGGVEEWPPPGIPQPPLFLASIGTLALLGSVVPIYLAESGVRRGDLARLRFGLLVGLVLAGVFLALSIVEHLGREYDWRTNAYASVFWAMGVFHAIHVGVLVLLGLGVAVLAWLGYFNAQRHMGVQATAVYWYFVAGAWIPFFATLYLAPRLI